MNEKLIEFATVEDTYINLTVFWSYSFDPGKLDGRPEDCYPAEEESEIALEAGWEQKIINLNPSMAADNLFFIEHQLQQMADKLPEWDYEDCQFAAEMKAEAEFDRSREQELGL